MSLCCSSFPNCNCHLEGKMLMNPSNVRRLQDALKKSRGCIVILKSGERIEMQGITVTRVKHMRRTGGEIPMTGEDGKKRVIRAKDIKTIYPLY